MLLNKEGGRGRAVGEKEGGVDVGYLRGVEVVDKLRTRQDDICELSNSDKR
jgi:hypothetical protein